LALQKQLAAESVALELGAEGDDPFASLGDNDDQDNTDPFSLDDEEQDITSFKTTNHTSTEGPGFSMSRGLTSLFSSGPHRGRQHETPDDFEASLDDSSSEGTDSDTDPENPPLEARTSHERRPLDIDDDEEMGEMVAPTEESNSSDEELLSSMEKQRLRRRYGAEEDEEPVSEFNGQQDRDGDSDEEGDGLVEIAMPIVRRLSAS
jgi:hypothetical protein